MTLERLTHLLKLHCLLWKEELAQDCNETCPPQLSLPQKAGNYWVFSLNSDSCFSEDYSDLFQRGWVEAVIFVQHGSGVNICPRWAKQELRPTTQGMKSTERLRVPSGDCELGSQVLWFVQLRSRSWCGERNDSHIQRGEGNWERGRRRASWFPRSLVLPDSSLLLHFCS